MKKQYYLVDIFKIIFALLVVSIHTFPLKAINEQANFYVSLTLGRIAVPFFFVASSFFLFRKINFSLDAKSEYNESILKNYLWRLLKLYLIWCAIYFVFTIFSWVKDGFSIISIIIYLKNLIFTGGEYHLWFLPAMIVSTIIVYALLYSDKKHKIFRIVLLLYIFGAIINLYGPVLMNVPIISSVIRVYQAIFETTRNGIFMAPIFTWMGYYIAKNPFTDNKKWLFKAVCISLILLIIEASVYHYGLKIDNDLACMYLSLIPLVFYLFNLLVKFEKNRIRIKLSIIRNLGTLIYLDHIIFVNLLPISNQLVKYGIVVLASIILSLVIIISSNKFTKLKELY